MFLACITGAICFPLMFLVMWWGMPFDKVAIGPPIGMIAAFIMACGFDIFKIFKGL